MKSIYELDMNMGMMLVGLIIGLNGYTMATVVLELCLVLTTLFFTNPNKSELMNIITMSVVYTIGVIGFTAILMPSWLSMLPFVLCCNGFTISCWYVVGMHRKKISQRLDQLSTLLLLMIIIFELAAWIMPVQWMILYSPLVQPWIIRIAMSVMILWMLLPLPLLMMHLHQCRVRYKRKRLFERLMD